VQYTIGTLGEPTETIEVKTNESAGGVYLVEQS